MENLDYRQFLREELAARSRRNSSYSCRAFARDLELSPSFLSQVLSGQRILGEEKAHAISTKLAWARWKKGAFVKLVRHSGMRDSVLRSEILSEVKSILRSARSKAARAKFHQLCLNEFKVISDWHHMALYELTALKEFREDPDWIGKKLGISSEEAKMALDRLVAVKLLERSDGKVQKFRGACKMGATPAAAIRSFHKQHLEKASRAIDTQVQDTRDFSGTTLAINVRKLPRAKALIRRFNEQLMQLLETGEQSAVYHFSVQLYRLDEDLHEKSKES